MGVAGLEVKIVGQNKEEILRLLKMVIDSIENRNTVHEVVTVIEASEPDESDGPDIKENLSSVAQYFIGTFNLDGTDPNDLTCCDKLWDYPYIGRWEYFQEWEESLVDGKKVE